MKARARYRIIRPLGRGAAGGVFLVEDRQKPGIPMALKRVHARADDLLHASFEREFAVLSSIASRGVGRVYDFGLADPDGEDTGGPFFTRTFVDGLPLDEAASELDEAARLALFADLCSVVAPLHRMGITHGDLKPANIIVDAASVPHVIDFGLASLETDDHRRRGAGTPAYMAPELLRGGSPTIASDVYALGATLYELFTGAPPFTGRGEAGLAARLEGALPEIPAGASALAREVLTVGLGALRADPLERLSTVGELLAALGKHLPDYAAPVAGFVAPRPRGHEAVLAQLDVGVANRTAGQGGEQSMLLVHGQSGGGKTTLLRELKWRLQVRGYSVLAVEGGHGGAVAPVRSLLAQALVAGGAADGELGELPKTDTEISEAIGAALGRAAARGPVAILVDDLDRAEALLGRALRLAIHADDVSSLALVATARDLAADAVREAGARHVASVPALSRDDVAALTYDAVGAVDVSVVKALFARTDGNPASVVDALSALSHRAETVTAADVSSLPATEAGEAAARARLAGLSAAAKQALTMLAVADVAIEAAVLAGAAGVPDEVLDALVASGLAVRVGPGLALEEHAVRAALLDDLSAEDVRAEAARILKVGGELPVTVRAALAVAAADGPAIVELAEMAAAELASVGAAATAEGLLEAFVNHAPPAEARRVELERSALLHGLGRYADAATTAVAVLRDEAADADERARAATLAGRARISAGEYDRALDVLTRVPDDAPAEARAAAYRERAKALLRKGDYGLVIDVAEQGIALSASTDPVRVELLTAAGMASSYLGDRDAAKTRHAEALSLARALGSRRDEANVMTYMAIDRHRSGDHRAAKQLYEESLEIARELSDVGSMATFALNLGAVSYDLGLPAKAAESYESAARLARRAGKASTEVMARLNLAQLHLYLGLYEKARVGTDSALHDAEEAGMRPAGAQAVAVLGDIAARTGDVEAALVRYDDAIARYRSLGQRREIAETLIDSAVALLDRAGPADTSAAISRLAEARALVDADELEEFRPRLTLLLARCRGENGDLDGAVTDLEALLANVRAADNKELEWCVLSALGVLNAIRGADFVARRQDQEAMEVLESIATRLPRDLREAFWHDPRRRDIRRRAGAGASTGSGRGSSGHGLFDSGHGVGLEARTARLLELIKRLASEHEVDRLLERITDSAVELAGAERGFVLLVGDDHRLEARTVRDRRAAEGDPHVAFSQSIAEAVLIDGEPIITIDARDDHRLSEYMSVHKLMLKSVACLPISGRDGTIGVLYLEHRMRRGRFDEADVDLLFAFADQAAIAIENARLIGEIESKRVALSTANEKLAAAKAEIERVLIARTAELEDAKREVEATRAELRGSYERHGIVGASEAMRRVFAIVDRVREASVSVVIHGESGTGKELVARAIHYGGSRKSKPFVAVNCAAIPEALLESELFGHVKGAFTGADRDRRGVVSQANGGTLFLDEVGDMPPKMQVDLLRVLQEKKVRPVGGDADEDVDVRVIAASNKVLKDLVATGAFREDLFYRLNVVELRLPPLRDRPTDVPLLVDHFLTKFAKRDGVPPKRLSRDALTRLAEHGLPGNVRQLEHVLLNAWVLVDQDIIEADDLALDGGASVNDQNAEQRGRLAAMAADAAGDARRAPPQSYDDFQQDEKQRILEALETNNWNRVRAAKALGIPRRTFYRRLKQYDILT